jgi:prepilin-type N-terminal cleavage/methylation domain-containing protein
MKKSKILWLARAQEGFSLVEMLVVISIVAVLAGLISFAVVDTMEKQNEKQCLSNMMMIEAAKDEYARDHVGQQLPSPDDSDFRTQFIKYFRFGIPRCPKNKENDYQNWNDIRVPVSCPKHPNNLVHE